MADLSSSPKLSRKSAASGKWVESPEGKAAEAKAEPRKGAAKPSSGETASESQKKTPAPQQAKPNAKESASAQAPAAAASAAPPPQTTAPKGGTIKSRGVAALISLFLPGVGLVLYDSKKMMEGAAVFVIAIILDILSLIIAFGGGLVAGSLCCILGPLLLLGIFLIPVVHIAAAIHTYMRTG